ncbi:MAG: F0F1 ATP synthase subunit delta [Odoribacter sp.]
MNEGFIARRYAVAMLKVARRREDAEEVYKKMKQFEESYVSHPDLQRALLNPVMSVHDKELLLSTAIGIESGGLYSRGIRLLLSHHREMYIRPICLMYQKLYRKKYQIRLVKIVVARELQQEVVDRIQKLVTDHAAGEVEFVKQVDPAIIGGFILKVDSMQLDVSVCSELKKMAKQLE